MIGQTLSHYEIVDKLGSGGMGDVYRARDTKLGRDVAIKVLPDQFSQDEERLARFKREAKVLASLNHPNIASIYGLEQSGDVHYLVLELVEGETLAERIARGPIPHDEAVAIAVQVAGGLEEAHERGVVHRDLKPANVKLTPDDKVKVLDFGLAKAFAEETPEADSSMSPTITRDATRAGVILGTAAYMSPEQAKGKRADKRTDIFSFGAVLYEMLTGKKAFPGDDVSEVLAAVIKLDPDWSAVPAGLTPLLQRCLDKDPRRRWRDIGDVKFELENDTPAQTPAVTSARMPWGRIAAGALVIGAVAGAVAWNVKPDSPRPVGRFAVNLPEGANFSFGGRRVIAFSPDGSRIAFVANRYLHLRALDEADSAALEDTFGARTPFFSPDGDWIGFYADGAINKVSVEGGPRVRLCAAENPFGASWTDEDTILFGQGERGIWRVSAQGGEPELVVEVGEGERAHGPELIPGTRFVLYSVVDSANWDEARIETRSLDGGVATVLIRGGSDARLVPTGHLVYAVDDTLVAVPFDADSLEILGGPVPVIEGVARSQSSTAAAHASFSTSGSLAYVPRDQIATRTIVWVDRSGQPGEPLLEPANYRTAVPSPDGNRLAVVEGSSPPNIWILDVGRSTLTRLTTEGAAFPVWSPDGEWLVFGLSSDLYRQRTDFSGNAEVLLETSGRVRPHAYSTDGKWLVYGLQNVTGWDLWTLPLEGDSEPQPIVVSEFGTRHATLSPDGRYIAYASNEARRPEIYVTRFPQSGQKWQISPGGGRQPLWSWDGRTIFYQEYGDTQSKIMSVRVETSPEFEWSPAELVMEWPTLDGPERHYAVSPDGERFAMLRDVNTGSGRIHFNVVLNWFDELERLVPTP